LAALPPASGSNGGERASHFFENVRVELFDDFLGLVEMLLSVIHDFGTGVCPGIRRLADSPHCRKPARGIERPG
jgi:hypothetical protein